MTKAKWNSDKRGLDADETLVRLARRLQSGKDDGARRQALESALGQVLHLAHLGNWQAGAVYRLAGIYVLASNEAQRRAAIDEFVDIVDARIPKISKHPDRLALTEAVTSMLHAAGFTAKEIVELVDDGHGGTAVQREARARSRFSANVSKSLQDFWASLTVNENDGPPGSP